MLETRNYVNELKADNDDLSKRRPIYFLLIADRIVGQSTYRGIAMSESNKPPVKVNSKGLTQSGHDLKQAKAIGALSEDTERSSRIIDVTETKTLADLVLPGARDARPSDR